MLILVMVVIICSSLAITGYNIYLAFTKNMKKLLSQKTKVFEISSLIYGAFLQCLAISFFFELSHKYSMEITTIDDYSPISTDHILTLICMVLVSFAGYLVLRLCDFNKISPIIIVLSLSAMFLFVLVSLPWILQTMPQLSEGDLGILTVCLFPFNFFLLIITTIKRIIFEWKPVHKDKKSLRMLERMLLNSKKLPLFAFIFMIPLLIVIIIILILFGQDSDSMIRAWTDTAEWTLSQQIPPPRLDSTGHYLCTVAANGHKKLVKQIRTETA